jgi:hypothetical protein
VCCKARHVKREKHQPKPSFALVLVRTISFISVTIPTFHVPISRLNDVATRNWRKGRCGVSCVRWCFDGRRQTGPAFSRLAYHLSHIGHFRNIPLTNIAVERSSGKELKKTSCAWVRKCACVLEESVTSRVPHRWKTAAKTTIRYRQTSTTIKIKQDQVHSRTKQHPRRIDALTGTETFAYHAAHCGDRRHIPIANFFI